MKRQQIFELVEKERAYQQEKWGDRFDALSTPNDWVAYISKYLGQTVTMPWNREIFRTQILKVMTLCCAVLEQESYAVRHYDQSESNNGRIA